MNRYLLDANVILNMVFIEGSPSKLLLSLAPKYLNFYVYENSLFEVEKVLNERVPFFAPLYFKIIKKTLAHHNILILNKTIIDIQKYPQIKGAGDKELVGFAKINSLNICSNDIDDFRFSKEYCVSCVTPEKLIQNYLDKLNDSRLMLPIYQTSPVKWFLFSRISFPYSSNNYQGGNLMYIFDAIGFGSIYYDPTTLSFVAIFDNGITINLNYTFKSNERLDVAVFLKNQFVTLRVNGKEKSTSCNYEFLDISKLTVNIGSSRNGDLQLNGHLLIQYMLPFVYTNKEQLNIFNNKRVIMCYSPNHGPRVNVS